MYDAKAMKEQLQFDFTHCRLFRSGNADTTTFRQAEQKWSCRSSNAGFWRDVTIWEIYKPRVPIADYYISVFRNTDLRWVAIEFRPNDLII
jgi:hypothetical protein